MLALGPLDLHMNNEGVMEVQDAALQFKNYKIDFILTSPSLRCLETAEIISKELKNVPIIIAGDLEERQFGNWATSKDKVKALVENAPEGPDFFKTIEHKIEELLPIDAESKEQFEKRIECAMKKYLNFFDNFNVLLVAHGCMRMILEDKLKVKVPANLEQYADAIRFVVNSTTNVYSVERI